ncbi:MAG: sigma-54-dependent Fis family transcriptional regulator, partial [Calditrichaeota bacterium]|nr:sigma-54-dependent Fis family transcriptional regulator [Calditrichota bacterium]
RVLQDGVVERVGGMQGKDVDVRVIAATNTDLQQAIAKGKFRSDLFYRLHVFPIDIPPLRERPQDIPLLVRHFMEKNRLQFKRPCQDIEEGSLDRLLQYDWPGNIRELKNIIERAMILSNSPSLIIEEGLIRQSQPPGMVLATTKLKDLERLRIEQALETCEWQIDGPLGAAKHLGLHPSTLRSRLKKLNISRKISKSGNA